MDFITRISGSWIHTGKMVNSFKNGDIKILILEKKKNIVTIESVCFICRYIRFINVLYISNYLTKTFGFRFE